MAVIGAVILFAHLWYPLECCGGEECRQVPCDSLSEDKYGVYWQGLFFEGNQVRQSQDNACHVCVSPNGRTLCVFINPVS